MVDYSQNALYLMAKGEDFNPVKAFNDGRQMAFENEQRKNALAELARENQARPYVGMAMRGDQNALASLSTLDPDRAMQVQAFSDARAKAKREVTAEDRDRIAGVLEWADTPQKWNQAISYLQDEGYETDETDTFENRGQFLALARGLKGGDDLRNKQQQLQISTLNAQPDLPSAVREFQFAQTNDGYQGTFSDWQAQGKGGAGGTIKPPSGYRWTDEGDLEPITGGPADPATKNNGGNPNVTTAMTNDAVKADQAYNNLTSALDDYTALVKDTGLSVLPGATQDAISQSRTNLQLQLKELYNLGVLNGPDLSLMEKMIFDPQLSALSPVESLGKVYSGAGGPGSDSIADRAEDSANRLKATLKRIRDNRARNVLDENGNFITGSGQQGGNAAPAGATNLKQKYGLED